MKLIRLFLGIVSVSLQREAAHRGNVVFQALLAAVSVFAGLATLHVIFSFTASLAGWTLDETVVLYGTFLIVSGVMGAFVEPNLGFFAGRLRNGDFDDVLLQPVPSLFLATLATCSPWALLTALLGVGTMGVGVARLGDDVTVLGGLTYGLLLGAGIVVAWASRVLLAALAFWAPGLEPSIFYGAFWQLGSYPVSIYSPPVRAVLTSVVPVAFIATVPARALTRTGDLGLVAGGMVAAAVAFALAVLVWGAGLRRYTSATS